MFAPVVTSSWSWRTGTIYSSAAVHADHITGKNVSDVILGWALVFDDGYIREIHRRAYFPLWSCRRKKNHVVYDLNFASGARARSSVNTDTDFGQATGCMLDHIMSDILSWVLSLRRLHGRSGNPPVSGWR